MDLRVCFGVLIGFAALLIDGDRAAAFCVYNRIADFRGDTRIVAEVLNGGSWQSEIAQGGGECCSWQDAHCNNSGRRDGVLSFRIISLQPGADNPRPCLIKAEAGGWLYITLAMMPLASEPGGSGIHLPVPTLRCREVRYKR